jgi:hypothetical protein
MKEQVLASPVKAVQHISRVLGYNGGWWSLLDEQILGGWVQSYPFLEISREDAGTDFANVDGGNVRP